MASVDSQSIQCADILGVFARGSGQVQNNRSSQKEAYKYFDTLDEKLSQKLSFEAQELIYPAAGADINASGLVFWFKAKVSIADKNSYHDSKNTGVRNTIDLLNKQVDKCPNQRFVIGGYSQGAHVMGDVLQQAGTKIKDRIAYAALFGDPKFNKKSFASKGSFYVGAKGLLGPRDEYPHDLKGKVGSWCKMQDGICEGNISTATGVLSKHNTYPEKEISIAVADAITALKTNFPQLGPGVAIPGALGPKTDIVFVSESTAQMRNYLQNLQGGMNKWIESITSLQTDVRLGLLEYNDKTNSCGMAAPVLRSDLTNDINSFKDRFNSLFGMCGGGQADGFAGLEKAIKDMSWRGDAKKVIIWLSANYPNSPDKINGFLPKDIADLAHANSISIHSVIRGDSNTTKDKYSSLTNMLGAQSSFVPLDRGLTPHANEYLAGVIKGLESFPTGKINKLRSERVGNEVLFNVGDLFDPDASIIKYDWDFNNDGIVDAMTETPFTSHMYSVDYAGLASVRAFSSDGSNAVLAAPITVSTTGPVYHAPSAITAASAQINQGNSVTIRWQNSSKNMLSLAVAETVIPDVDHYLIKNADSEIIAVVGSDQDNVEIQDLDDSRSHRFSVEAVNSEGASVPVYTNDVTFKKYPDLAYEQKIQKQQFRVGEKISIEHKVRNEGSAEAEDIVLQLSYHRSLLPINFKALKNAKCKIIFSGKTLCKIEKLAPNQQVIISTTHRGITTGGFAYKGEVSSASVEDNLVNNRAQNIITIVANRKLARSVVNPRDFIMSLMNR